MLVVLSWFVHSVYNVDCYAWTAKACAAASNCDAAGTCNQYRASCCGSGYYIAHNGAALSKYGYYVYRTNNTASIAYPNTTLVCLTETDYSDAGGNSGTPWCCEFFSQDLLTFGGCNAFLSSAQLSGELPMTGAVLHASTLKVTADKTGGIYVGMCRLTPGYYVSGISWPSTSTGAKATIAKCPAGYYCPGGSIGTFIFNASGISAGKGRNQCGAGYYCNGTGRYSRVLCPIGSYTSSATASLCSTCPSQSGVAGITEQAGAPYLTACYIPANSGMSTSDGHTIAFISNCYYT